MGGPTSAGSRSRNSPLNPVKGLRWTALDLSGAAVPALRATGAQFRDCVIDGANLTETLWTAALIGRCTFKTARLDSAQFLLHTTLDRVVFTGPLRDVMFDGRTLRGEATADPLRDVDFAQAMFANVEFRGYRFDRVRVPEGVRAIPHWPEITRRALELVARDRSTEGRMLAGEFRNWMNMIGQGDATGVFNRADYVTAGGEKLAQFAESVLWRTVEPERR